MDERTQLRILVIDGDAHARRRCVELLRGGGDGRFAIDEAGDAAAVRACLESDRPDCVLLDGALPGGDALALLRELSWPRARVRAPVVMLMNDGDTDLAIASIQAGALDYAVKSRLTAEGLRRSVRNAIEKHKLQHELEARQDALEASRRRELEMKEELLSHVSHELRTPLTAIHQFVSIVLDGVAGELAPRQREFLEIVHRNAQQLRDMIGDIMEVSRIGAGKLVIDPSVMELGPIIDDALTSLARAAQEKNVSLRVEVPAAGDVEALPPVLADGGRVRQIVANLVGNAVKFSAKGGLVCVRAAAEAADVVRVSVQDRGPGIAPEALSRIFERMHQELSHVAQSRRGLGLGLYICRELVRGHGGTIWAESELGSGSTLHFTLPVYSLRRLIRPLFLLEGEPAPGAHLLAIDLGLDPDAVLAAEADAIVARLRHEIEALVHRDRDIVLPREGSSEAHGERRIETCFVVAHADAQAASAMASRLLRALRRSELVCSTRTWIGIRLHGLLVEPRPAVLCDAWLGGVAARVEEAIRRDRAASAACRGDAQSACGLDVACTAKSEDAGPHAVQVA
jgi:signal transduction histidine kinase